MLGLGLSLTQRSTFGTGGGLPSLTSFMRGTNVSGQDSGGSIYAFPIEQTFDYFVTRKKAKAIRLTFRHERMQPTVGGNLSSPYVDRYEGLVNFALAKGAFPIIDPHNFGRYFVGSTFDDYSGPTGGTETIIGQGAGYTSAQFADFWTKLANRFPDPRVIYNLMNEPHDQQSWTLTATLNDSIAAIRAAGKKNLILVPFNGYSNRYGFISDQAAQTLHLTSIVDSASNWAIDYHCYVDAFSAGQSTSVQANFLADVEAFTTWARANGKKAFCGEFGVATDRASMRAAMDFLRHLEANKDVWIGFAWWTAVNYQDSYSYQLLPTEMTDNTTIVPNPTDRLQMDLLEHLFAGVPVAPAVLLGATLTGTAKVGQTLGGLPAVFSGFPIPTVSYKWQRDGVDIVGAAAATYTLVSGDIGSTVRRVETATNASGTISSTTSSSATVTAFAISDLGTTKVKAWFRDSTATVGSWPDSSGNARDGVMATAANQPTVSGAGGLTFNRVTDRIDVAGLTAADNDEICIAVITIPSSLGGARTIFGGSVNGRQMRVNNTSGVVEVNNQGTSAVGGGSTNIPRNTKALVAWNKAIARVYVNSLTAEGLGYGNSYTSTTFTVLGNRGASGNGGETFYNATGGAASIHEAVFLQAASLVAGDFNTVISDLATRHGITLV